MFDIGENFLFIQAYARYTVASRPYAFLGRVCLLQKRKFRFKRFCQLCLDILHSTGNCNPWRYHNHHVNMVYLNIELYHLDIGASSGICDRTFSAYCLTPLTKTFLRCRGIQTGVWSFVRQNLAMVFFTPGRVDWEIWNGKISAEWKTDSSLSESDV